MCRRIEDCLVTRTGFRVFVISVVVVIVAAIGLNLSYKFLLETPESASNNEALLANNGAKNKETDHHILLWTPLHGSWSHWWTDTNLGAASQLQKSNCPQLRQCSFSSDRTSLNSSNLIIYSYSDIDLSDMPPKYAAGQKWGLFLPTPTDRHSGEKWSRFLPMFDLLISYYPNSNIQMYRGKTMPYHVGQSVKYNDSISVEHTHYEVKFRKLFREIMDKASKGSDTVQRHLGDLSAVSESEENKERLMRIKRHHKHLGPKFKEGHRKRRRAFQYDSRLVATIIEDCHTDSNREGYIEAMSEHVNIHIYGSCGAPCPGESPEVCLQYLSRFYKFVLVFESFMCQHFMSDLIWAVLKTDMVPVVFGGVNYSKVLPLGSYIDALNQSPKNLAHFLRHLDKNDELYNNYLQWKDEYMVEQDSWLCQLCSSLDSATNQFAFPPTQVSLEPPADMCTSWPELKFGIHGKQK